MNLYRIFFTHIGPKDSKQGTECFLLAPDEEAVLSWIEKEHNYERFSDEPTETSFREEWWDANQVRVACAQVMGLEVDRKYRSVSGPRRLLYLWNRDDPADPPSDCVDYGVTQWGWEPVDTAPEHKALVESVLTHLGMLVRAESEE